MNKNIQPAVESKSASEKLREQFSFWGWFFRGADGSEPGYKRFFTWALIAHASVGAVLGMVVQADIKSISTAMVLPVASILVGLTFSWAGNSQALLQTKELKRLGKYLDGGLNSTASYYQGVILLVLVASVAWGLGSIGLFDQRSMIGTTTGYMVMKCFLFSVTSLTLRECWQVVNATRHLLITRSAIEDIDDQQDNECKCDKN